MSAPRLVLRGSFAFALAAMGCVIDPVSFEGKSCPCPRGYRCDARVAVCLRGEESPGGSGGTLGGFGGTQANVGGSSAGNANGGGGAAGGGVCAPRVIIGDFRAAWATPNTIRWAWTPTGTVDEFGSYRLVVGPTKTSVDDEIGVTIFTAAENPELGKLNLVHTGGIDPVESTISDGLAPGTGYFAKLVATDHAGCTFTSPTLAAKTTIAPLSSLPLFVDTVPSGAYVNPGTIVVAPSCASGSACLAYENDCPDGTAMCFENVRLSFALPGETIGAQMTKGDFANLAYLEIRVATDTPGSSDWSEIRLKSGDFYGVKPLPLRSGAAFRTYQLPLRALVSGVPLTYETLIAQGLGEFAVGGHWANHSHVWIDDVSLRW